MTRPFPPGVPRSSLLRLYDPFSRLVGVREARWTLVAQAGIEPGSAVLDLGTGTGDLLVLAAQAAPTATLIGVDPDAEALTVARRKLAGTGVRIEQAFADELPLPDAGVDRVLSAFAFHHVPEGEKTAALREVRRVLAPGGRLHLMEFDGRPAPAPVVAAVNLAMGRLENGLRRPRHGHGHGRDQGPDFAHSRPAAVVELLGQAGFTDVTVSGRGRSGLGDHVLYRATNPPGTTG